MRTQKTLLRSAVVLGVLSGVSEVQAADQWTFMDTLDHDLGITRITIFAGPERTDEDHERALVACFDMRHGSLKLMQSMAARMADYLGVPRSTMQTKLRQKYELTCITSSQRPMPTATVEVLDHSAHYEDTISWSEPSQEVFDAAVDVGFQSWKRDAEALLGRRPGG